MPLDIEALKAIMNRPAHRVREIQGSSDPKIEAKANREVVKILNSHSIETNDKVDVTPVDDSQHNGEYRFDVTLPRSDISGLIDPSIVLDESQELAIHNLLEQQYGCLIGAAGSGKTTIQKYLIYKLLYTSQSKKYGRLQLKKLSGKQGINIACCAFTGAALQVIKKNLPPWLHQGCKTIHELLEYMPVGVEVDQEDGSVKESRIFLPSRDATNKLDHDVIIIDEFSMVGLDLWNNLLDACKPGTRIYAVGDLYQLPPIASESTFAHALGACLDPEHTDWHMSELTHIHRQKEEGANRIIDAAHAILNGQQFKFDDPTTDKNWRVIGMTLDNDTQIAGQQIVAIANQLRTKRVHSSVDPDKPLIYDPIRDRIITAGNGYDANNTASAVQQYYINYALSHLIEPPSDEKPIYIIDAGREQKRFAVGHKVMATRNESPGMEGRVTNGLTGIVREITKNPAWSGNHQLVGPEHEVEEHKKKVIHGLTSGLNQYETLAESLANTDFSGLNFSAEKASKEGGGPASHRVTVEFINGSTRTYATKTAVEQLQLAYASTCHKCQGSQFDTAIIIVHHAAKAQLSREWLYTAITRAVKRVVFLYTDFGIKNCLAKQRIFGNSLEEKVRRYIELENQNQSSMLIKTKRKIRLTI